MTSKSPGSRPTFAATTFSFCTLLLALLTSGCQIDRGQSDAVKRPTLRWEAPASREDGSRLYTSDIKEYRIYYRLRHQSSFRTISRPVDQGTAFTLDQFVPGAYLFSVTAVDREGRESRPSEGVEVNLI